MLGFLAPFQPPIREPEDTKYGDLKWPLMVYPPYISGAGILLNWIAVQKINAKIPKTPIITIDDAFIGICAQKERLILIKITDFYVGTIPFFVREGGSSSKVSFVKSGFRQSFVRQSLSSKFDERNF